MKIISMVFPIILLLSAIFSVMQQPGNEMPHGNIQFACEECHNPTSWSVDLKAISFRHEKTGFPLEGVHSTTDCRDCHETLVFSHIGTACIDCHQDVHQGEFGIKCGKCHTVFSWENRMDLRKDHQHTEFPLVGMHAVIDCEACHYSNRKEDISRLPVRCDGCHFEDFNSSDNPNHQLAKFSRECEECHSVASMRWTSTSFIHTETFRLDGAHRNADCSACHSMTFKGTPSVCFACHTTDFQQAKDPDHVAFGFITECQICHNTIRWEGTVFDHFQSSGFQLAGAHQNISCTECHENNQVTGLPRECFGCHENDFRSTTDPNHVTNNFDHNCLECHSNVSWTPSTFDHAGTAFPLTGAHLTLNCIECHSGGYTGTPTDCYSCHNNDFNGVSDPSHTANNFSHDCTQCHTTSAWSPASFDHANTAFPLTGAHLTLNCIDCHASGYTGTPTDCYSCHNNDFNGVSDPSHTANNFSHDCTQCHTTSAWSPASFDHTTTRFPLTGAHVNLACDACHAGGFANTPIDCYSCHLSDYTAATNPNHSAAGFPVQCESCHNTSAWQPSSWDHDAQFFPIYSGRHQGEWNICADCHVAPNNFVTFECIFCHEHDDPVDLADKHRNVPGYQYVSIECYNCHPRGED